MFRNCLMKSVYVVGLTALQSLRLGNFLSSGTMEICSEICEALSLDNPLKTASWNLRF